MFIYIEIKKNCILSEIQFFLFEIIK